ncbi:4-(cytidine 5'-diphospho)-2-C-methyl-D-erythritol kinase [Corynebacterium aquatimens]|uniref:4-diphosphocytidyl-2-C-methyl-D-erythritol kinase n=1 Tax=Corynebacterium aquatimens TaxID=1190508 RepID=A0A931GRL5_9CORY|nr:4-(cytidine 5'-diphospho)-2-C-methyl-D-erythritol kinase [Corynebacterium aquatimens]MBG6121152.1 4-diphosphocytidyl-2-C-methyl-D-erythritol kinase [Corynebacterium aquatimens]WJY66293.1 4-diphosphocytidyl-2-C-methyl-D-erythritol kinase [Corynebacterium aquatimens]
MARVFQASAPGKVNLHLGVGAARPDGYHELSTVFMAVDRVETVTLTEQPGVVTTDGGVVAAMNTTFRVEPPTENIDGPGNLAWRAVETAVQAAVAAATADAAGAADAGADPLLRPPAERLPAVRIDVDKTVPVAGGMAGGSADAAAALIAANAYLAHHVEALPHDTLVAIGRSLGADVPFCMMGGIALGTARGDELVSMMGRGEYWFVFVNPRVGLSTGAVFERLDEMRYNSPSLVPRMETGALARALMSGDPREVAAAMHNDLEAAAVSMEPGLKGLADVAVREGGLRAMVSGSGPTLAVLCEDQARAHHVCERLRAHTHSGDHTGDLEIFVARGPVPGAH